MYNEDTHFSTYILTLHSDISDLNQKNNVPAQSTLFYWPFKEPFFQTTLIFASDKYNTINQKHSYYNYVFNRI